MVSALDEGIGNITDTFKQKGMWDNTVVIFTTGLNSFGGEGGRSYSAP